ncbi:MAG: SMC-Scp complex subunit ScpB [Clostridiales bacterium]|nr:SMC-Scp complex subunit ScpB [Clostridiales bacterium]
MNEKAKVLEALLFATGAPLPLSDLADAICETQKETFGLIEELSLSYREQRRGILIRRVNDSYQMCTNPIYYDELKRMLQVPQRKVMTQPILETLAIIAYQQPVTKAVIEEIRGVNADHCVNKLLEYNLIMEKGRMDMPGRPLLFGTTEEFLRHFGFENLSQLPDLCVGDDEASEPSGDSAQAGEATSGGEFSFGEDLRLETENVDS